MLILEPPVVGEPFIRKAQHDVVIRQDIMIGMPKSVNHHHACTDRCDMLQGPCACGAWHNLSEWPAEYLAAALMECNESA